MRSAMALWHTRIAIGERSPGLVIPRGECCVYIFKVWVYDRTFRGGSQYTVYGYGDWPVKICNDLPQ